MTFVILNRLAPDTGETMEVVHGAKEANARIARFLARANSQISICTDRRGLGTAMQ